MSEDSPLLDVAREIVRPLIPTSGPSSLVSLRKKYEDAFQGSLETVEKDERKGLREKHAAQREFVLDAADPADEWAYFLVTILGVRNVREKLGHKASAVLALEDSILLELVALDGAFNTAGYDGELDDLAHGAHDE